MGGLPPTMGGYQATEKVAFETSAEHVVITTFGGSIWSKLTTKGLLKHQHSEQSVCSLKLAHTCYDGQEIASEEVASETSEHL